MARVLALRTRENAYNISSLLDQLLEAYDNSLRPGFGSEPTVIDVNMNIRSMGPISKKDMAYQMDCYFRQSWEDSRLAFSGNGTPSVLPVSITILDRLWKPDTHFFNGMKSYLHVTTSPNKLLRINRTGRILYPMRWLPCIGLAAMWTYGPKSIRMAPDMTLSQFDLIGFPHGSESLLQPSIGNFSMFSILYVKFTLRRHMGYFIINVYFPSSLLVVLSWVAFWINREATSDRISLRVTTILTMCFMSIDNRRDTPKVSYSTALDYFVAALFTFVLATIIQFGGVHFFTKTGYGEIQHDSDSEDEEDTDINPQNVHSTDQAYSRRETNNHSSHRQEYKR